MICTDRAQLGPWMRRQRLDKRKTGREIADWLGHSDQAMNIYRWERGVVDPTISTLIKWADALDFDLLIDVVPRERP